MVFKKNSAQKENNNIGSHPTHNRTTFYTIQINIKRLWLQPTINVDRLKWLNRIHSITQSKYKRIFDLYTTLCLYNFESSNNIVFMCRERCGKVYKEFRKG